MSVTVVLPGFGYNVIDHDIVQRQPWHYLIRIAENLVTSGYKVRICFQDTRPQDTLTKVLIDKGMIVCSSLELNQNDVVVIPFAVGYYAKLRKKLHQLTSELNCKVYIALTTYIDNIKNLITNYVIVKLTRTGKTIGKTLAENMALRVWHNKLLNNVSGIITPSRDFINILYDLGIGREIEVIEFIPPVDVPCCCNVNHDEKRDVIAYFGPFDEERGVISLINAFLELIKERGSDVVLKLLIRENGCPLPPSITKKIEMMKRNIVITTKSENKRILFTELCMSKLVVLPYRVIPSTIPISYLEALFLGGPLVVTTNIPGFREHVCSYLSKVIPGTYRYRDLAEYITFFLNSTENSRLRAKQLSYTKSLINRIQKQLITLPEE